ncbi:peptide deformylase [Shewanella maritima]|uniref:peptide deformylase n=1 Tax=Shewanella maritima TaxID=2520507 RepID=UPI0037352925
MFSTKNLISKLIPTNIKSSQLDEQDILPIATTGEPVLTQKAVAVTQFDDHLKQLSIRMLKTMQAANGIGIAAPQVFSPLAVFIIASAPNERYPDAPLMNPTLMVNPRIIYHSIDIDDGLEGCLSIPNKRFSISRYKTVMVEYQNIHGQKIQQHLEGFVARIFQHELDHLLGITLLERTKIKKVGTYATGQEAQA